MKNLRNILLIFMLCTTGFVFIGCSSEEPNEPETVYEDNYEEEEPTEVEATEPPTEVVEDETEPEKEAVNLFNFTPMGEVIYGDFSDGRVDEIFTQAEEAYANGEHIARPRLSHDQNEVTIFPVENVQKRININPGFYVEIITVGGQLDIVRAYKHSDCRTFATSDAYQISFFMEEKHISMLASPTDFNIAFWVAEGHNWNILSEVSINSENVKGLTNEIEILATQVANNPDGNYIAEFIESNEIIQSLFE